MPLNAEAVLVFSERPQTHIRQLPAWIIGRDGMAEVTPFPRSGWVPRVVRSPDRRPERFGVSRRVLFERLEDLGRVTVVSAPAGSGKTFLLRSSICETGLEDSVAWASVRGEERDPQRFWLSVLDALRASRPGSRLVRELTAAPDLDGWAIVDRLLEDLDALEDRLWLVLDDVHELRSTEALRQLELLLAGAPTRLRFVILTRGDLQLGLHRLRLAGELMEIRGGDLRFTVREARALLDAAGVELSDSALELLVERTEGWAAGLRLAALSLTGHPDPERFAAEFSGGERTVTEYLLAEILDRQSEEARRLLLRTSILERVNGPLADLLTGGSGGERILHELEEANAFVVSLDARRSWFRYHRLFAEVLQLELRRTAPQELPALHHAAAGWYAEQGYPLGAIRHAQAAEDWSLAAQVLSDHWFVLELNGQAAAAHDLLAGFAPGVVAGNPELTALMAAAELNRGSSEAAERHLMRATRDFESVPAHRRGRFQVTLGILRLVLARQVGDLPTVSEEAQRLLAPVDTADVADLGMSEEQRALALISLGVADSWSDRIEEAERHLEQGVALARRVERPYLEITGLAHLAGAVAFRSHSLAAELSQQATELAERHGWAEEPVAGPAYVALVAPLLWQARLEEAEPWLERAERVLRAEADRTVGVSLRAARGLLERARGRDPEALAALQATEGLAGQLVTPHPLAGRVRMHRLQTLIRLGETEAVEREIAGTDDQDRESAEMRTVLAALRLVQGDPEDATVALAPVLDGRRPTLDPGWMTLQALLLEAIAQDMLGDAAASERALERALDLAEADGVLLWFLLHPASELLERHPRHRTAHGALLTEILSLLAGRQPVSRGGHPESLSEPPSDGELRVLRYLPTSLSASEIAAELCLSVNTVKTHMRHLYAKLGAHRRAEAIGRARAVGLLAPSSLRR